MNKLIGYAIPAELHLIWFYEVLDMLASCRDQRYLCLTYSLVESDYGIQCPRGNKRRILN